MQKPEPKTVKDVVIRFAGDSGDGMQLTGSQFTQESAMAGNDLATLPDFPAEIRAPAGSIAGVSAFQIHIGSSEINTPGDRSDVLVAMNPAALKANLENLKAGGILIANEDSFKEKGLSKVGYESNPLEDDSIREKFRIYPVPISKLTKEALVDSGLSSREVERCKNFFTLGITLWMFHRGPEKTLDWINEKFSKNEMLAEANRRVLKAGMTYAEATEIFSASFVVKPAKLKPGKYKNLNGTKALSYGLIAAAQKSGLELFFGAYPITPASDLLHELARKKHYGIQTFQAEDEIAAICAAIGASFTGGLGITSSSGPGIALKTEAMNLAVMTELPLVIINIQRGGPSTGLPTKTEQSDLHNAIYGRPGDAPLCVIAASTPQTAFSLGYEACRIATKYMTPVLLLSEGYIANSSAPWRIPRAEELKPFESSFMREEDLDDKAFEPYTRDEKTLARPWAIPGTPGLTHRIGGLEKQAGKGNVSYDPDNHDRMTRLRAEKIARIQAEIPKIETDGERSGKLLVLGWGGTEGSLKEAVRQARESGLEGISRAHLHYLNPLSPELKAIIEGFERVLIAEINMGQLWTLLNDRIPEVFKKRHLESYNIVRGQPLMVEELTKKISEILKTH